jgi:hypothetical protein
MCFPAERGLDNDETISYMEAMDGGNVKEKGMG